MAPHLPNELWLRIAWFVLKCETCHCHHVSNHLSALARCSHHLHFVLTPELLRTASALNILLSGIGHSRPATVALAITLGADLDLVLCESICWGSVPHSVILGTAVEIAFRIRIRCVDPAVHQLSLEVCTMLLLAGGTPTSESLSSVANSEDVDLLRCCLPYIGDINAHDKHDRHTLLELAGLAGNDGIVTVLLAAGAKVNSSGPPGHPDYFPPLWTLCAASLAVVDELLTAGADATWEHNGESIIAHLVQNHKSSSDVDWNVNLLAWHGAEIPTEIELCQAPVWESWTDGVLEEPSVPAEREPRIDVCHVQMANRGFMMHRDDTWDEWGPIAAHPELDHGCGCPVCGLRTTRGYRAVREMEQDGCVPLWGCGLFASPRC